VREAVFNVLRDVSGLRFLDLFAGTGAVGIEALSRGAANAVFVDNAPVCIKVIHRNVEKSGFAENVEILKLNAENAAKALSGRAFDIIYADPPYGRPPDFIAEILFMIKTAGLLADGGTVIIERRKNEVRIDYAKHDFIEIKTKFYSNAQVTFLQAAY